MTEIGLYLLDHWVLSSLFLIILGLLVVHELFLQTRGAGASHQEVIHLMNHARGVVIDVRSKEAFDEGHILNAINIPYEKLDKQLNQIKKYQSRPVILVCAQGMTASKACAWLKARGFKEAKCLQGGLESWKANDLPLTNKA